MISKIKRKSMKRLIITILVFILTLPVIINTGKHIYNREVGFWNPEIDWSKEHAFGIKKDMIDTYDDKDENVEDDTIEYMGTVEFKDKRLKNISKKVEIEGDSASISFKCVYCYEELEYGYADFYVDLPKDIKSVYIQGTLVWQNGERVEVNEEY